MTPKLKSPFPYFGGKSAIATEVWSRFGTVNTYVEPFCGSLAVLLSRPEIVGTETVNDRDHHLANFWRALKCDARAVEDFATAPISECELRARRRYVIEHRDGLLACEHDPAHYDARMAGYWVYGISLWLGDGWTNPGYCDAKKRPGRAGGIHRRSNPPEYLARLSERLRNVTVLCGDWRRTVTPCALGRPPTGVFLDPPYPSHDLYAIPDSHGIVADDAREWATANGNDPNMRIALCGYACDGQPAMPDGWTEHAWTARGGYGNRHGGHANANRSRERIWFSPHCENRRHLFVAR